MISTIRFLRPWNRRVIGQIDRLSYGMSDTLVRRGIAEFVVEKREREPRKSQKEKEPEE